MAEITITDATCPACKEKFDLENYDPEQEINDTECPECGAMLTATEYDPAGGSVVLEEVVDDDEIEDGEDADLIQDDEDDEDAEA